MEIVTIQKEGAMFGAIDDVALLLNQFLGYKLYTTKTHIKTGFPLCSYEKVKNILKENGYILVVDGYSEITVIYEFKWTSTSNAITIFKNNTIVGTVLLSNEEMSMFKNNLNGG